MRIVRSMVSANMRTLSALMWKVPILCHTTYFVLDVLFYRPSLIQEVVLNASAWEEE